MGYNTATYKITAPVSVDDVKMALGILSSSVNDVQSLCCHPNINIWSKHKPVQRNEVAVQDFDSSRGDYNSTWWKGENLGCGWEPKRTTKANLPTVMDGDLNGWKKKMPQKTKLITETYLYRLGDFVGYCENAVPPFKGASVSLASTGATTMKPTVTLLNSPTVEGTSSDMITLADFNDYFNSYYGDADATKLWFCCFYKVAGSTATPSFGGYADARFGKVTFTANLLKSFTYEIYPVFIIHSGNTTPSGIPMDTASIWTFPGLPVLKVNYNTGDSTVTGLRIFGKAIRTGTTVSVSITVENLSTTQYVDCDSNWIRLRTPSTVDIYATMTASDKSNSLASFRVNAGAKVIKTATFTNVTGTDWIVHWSFKNATYQGKLNIVSFEAEAE